MYLDELRPGEPGGLELADLAQLPGHAAEGVYRLLGLSAQSPVLCLVQPGIGAPGIDVSLQLA